MSWSLTSDCIRQQPAEHGTHEPPVEPEPEELLEPVELASALEELAALDEPTDSRSRCCPRCSRCPCFRKPESRDRC